MGKEKKKSKISISTILSYATSGIFVLFASFFIYKLIQNNNETHDPILIENVCKRTNIQYTRQGNKFCFTDEVSIDGEKFRFPSKRHTDLLQIHVKSKKINVTYNSKSFEQISGNYPTTKFCIDHQFPGNFNITVTCNFDPIFEENFVDLKELNATVGQQISHMTTDSQTMLVLTDFCVNMHDDVIFLSNNDAQISPVPVSMNQDVSFWVMPPHTQTRRFPIEEYTTIFITSSGGDPWMTLMGSLLPLWRNNIYANQIGVKYRRFNMQKEDVAALQRMIPDEKILLKDRCYHMGVFPKGCISKNNKDYADMFKRLTSSTKEEINAFRNAMAKSSFVPKKVIIDRQFAKDCPDIFNIMRGYNISILNEKKPVHEIADEIHSAEYFVTSHLTTAIFGIFLSEKATIIERRILDAGCLDYIEKLMTKIGVKYHEIGHEEICNIGDFGDYFTMPNLYSLDHDYLNEVIDYITNH